MTSPNPTKVRAVATQTESDLAVTTLAAMAKSLGLHYGGRQPGIGSIPDCLLYTKRNPMSPIHGHTLALPMDFATPDQLLIIHNNAVRAAVARLPKFEAMPDTQEA